MRWIEAQPAGPPRGALLLLHAFPVDARMWEPQLELAASGWLVIAPHFPGFGPERTDAVAESVDDYADAVLTLMDRLGIERAVIAGLSMGGYVSFAMFRRAPDRFRAIVLADTRADADTPQAAEGRRKLLETLVSGGVEAVSAEMVPKLLGSGTRQRRPEVVDRVRHLALSQSPAAIAAALHAMLARPDSTPLLSAMKTPALVLVGAEDGVTPPGVAGRLHQAISGSSLELVPGAGHLSNLEQPALFNQALSRFLERV